DLAAELGEAGRRHQPDVAGADHGDWLARVSVCHGAREASWRRCGAWRACALLADLQEGLPAPDVAQRACLLLGALLGALGARAGLREALLLRGAVQRLGRDRLLDQDERPVFGELQIAICLGEAIDVRLRVVLS